jgi:hypothetical protein
MNWGRWTFVVVGLLVLCFLLACSSASAEAAPSAPVPSYSSSLRPVISAAPMRVSLPEQGRPHLFDLGLYTSIAGYRTLDYLSTRRALAGGAREVELPQWVVDNPGTFIAFEGLATATEVGSSVWLIHHGHRRIARAANMVSVGLGFQTVIHNYTEPLNFAH